MRKTGTYQKIGHLDYFIPDPLPPSNPPFELSPEIMALYGEASFELGQLNEMGVKLPDPKRFIRAYVIKEALLSSSIEGIHTTLIDVFTHVIGDSKPSKSTQLVLNYIKSLDVAVGMLKDEKLPLVLRVITRAHEALMTEGQASPGEFRQQAVRVGDFVPPPAHEVMHLMGMLENYINEPSEIPALIRAGLVHVQFETIHPFLDGNGRIGRLIIILMMLDNNLLSLPILYPSYYFKKHHFEYYQRLDRVRTEGDFEGWIVFYLKAVRDSAKDANMRAKEIESLEQRLKDVIQTEPRFSKIKETALAALTYLFTQPITSVTEMSQKINRSYNTTQRIVQEFIAVGFVSENVINKRNKLYKFEAYLAVLENEFV